MKTTEVVQIGFENEEPAHAGSARRSPKSVEQQLTGCTLTELMYRSEAVTQVLKNILRFPVLLTKNGR